MMQAITIQAKAVEKIANAAVARGVSAETLYETVNVDASALEDPDSRIPFAQLVALYEKAAELTGDNNFGLHIGESVNSSSFALSGIAH